MRICIISQNSPQYKMNQYIKARTNGINCYGTTNELKILEQMFPIYVVDDQDVTQALEKHFDKSNPQHVRFLRQTCFKTPLAEVARVYEDFRQKRHPTIEEPRISQYYKNDEFVSLSSLEKWIDGEGQYPSFANADNIKQQIKLVLLSLSEQFGYIPNLERFLLYYPNYLIKVLKFKNRFFQQRIQQTCQVTYLSPKNCCFAGIIAAISIGCPYMIARMINMFLVRDGNVTWITQKKYPEQFKPLFNLFNKIAVAPWSVNESDLQFGNKNWDKEVYFDYILAGVFVMTMSNICLALGLIPDQPCKYFPMEQMLEIKRKYDKQIYQSFPNKKKLLEEIKEMINPDKQFTKEQVQQIEGKQVEPYMKQIGNKLSTRDLYIMYNKMFNFIGVPELSPANMKAKNNSFYHRYRDIIEKGLLQQQKKIDKLQDTKFECFKSFCMQGSTMTFNNFGKKEHNTRIFRKLIQVMTQNLCGYHNQNFDYKKNIKLNLQLTMPLKFYVRLLSISSLYINKQVLNEINHESGWIQCFDLGHLAIMVSENKAKLLVTSILCQLFK